MLESVLLSIFLDVQVIYYFSWRNIQTKVIAIISDVDGNDNSKHLLNIYQTTYIVLNFLTEVSHSILLKMLWDRCHKCPGFVNVEDEPYRDFKNLPQII